MTDRLDRKIRLRAMWCHLSGLAWIPGVALYILDRSHGWGTVWFWLVVLLVLPWLIPIISWRNSRRLHPFVDLAGRTTINAASSAFLAYWCLTIPVSFLLSRSLIFSNYDYPNPSNSSDLERSILLGLGIFGLILAVIIVMAHFCMSIYAAIRAYRGKIYCYPSFNFIKGVKQLSADLSKKL